ncbi:MAG: ATP-dependent zinc metalloprotease FtsH [Chloroflexota bacterium]|nr:ATP-dependent zinc metalloprotease FtsH [Chloroflexota bacterium]
MNNRLVRNGFMYLVLAVAILVVLFVMFNPGQPNQQTVPISELLSRVESAADGGSQPEILVSANRIVARVGGGGAISAVVNDRFDIDQALANRGLNVNGQQVAVQFEAPSPAPTIISILTSILPLLIFVGLLVFMMRQAQGSNSQALSFGKSRPRMVTGNRPRVTFKDVQGVDEAKQELAEVVEFLKYPEKFTKIGAEIPRGVLLVGPPGTGKTHLSKAVAGEAGVPFFNISGSEFVEMFVGVGASRVRDLFEKAKQNSPSLVFVDEIDAVGRQRGAGLGGSHDEREQTLNQILVEMDGFDTDQTVIVLAATNRPDVLDPALLRPGRFDRRVVLDLPDIRGREAILRVHAREKPIQDDVDLGTIARQTPGFSGADLKNLLNEAAILAARRNRTTVGMFELEEAIDRVIAGPQRKSRVMSEHEKRVTAFHEIGHALVAHLLRRADPVYKVTILPRGQMGGYTRFLPSQDRHLLTKSEFEDQLAVAMGGHAAEVLVFGEMTTGPSNDIQMATEIARRMVTQYGMSTKLGPRAFGRREELVFLGRDIAEQRNYSEAIAETIDREVSQLIDDAHHRAQDMLARNRGLLEKLSETLIEVETLDAEAFERYVDEYQGRTPASTSDPQPAPPGPTPAPAAPASPADPPAERTPAPKQRPAEGAAG